MNELDHHLVTALEKLSQQYSEEQEQQLNQIKDLQQQVMKLTNQQSLLIESYTKIAQLLKEELTL